MVKINNDDYIKYDNAIDSNDVQRKNNHFVMNTVIQLIQLTCFSEYVPFLCDVVNYIAFC